MFERRCAVSFAMSILLTTVAAAQDNPQASPRASRPLILQIQDSAALPNERVITLDDAQQRAQVAAAPLMRLGELQVEAARQHRLGVRSLYFPSISAQAD